MRKYNVVLKDIQPNIIFLQYFSLQMFEKTFPPISILQMPFRTRDILCGPTLLMPSNITSNIEYLYLV